mmetsp:Transcript_6254/g.9064  ORF Transcript_6254/g.9064 Transcript_6254/m.9064 type:complete len:220 (-) Transcript_6254:1008-1667(-)
MRITNVRDPIPHSFVDGILKSPLSILDWYNLRPQGVHTKNIELLSFAVNSTHVNSTVETKHCANCGGCDTVLSSTSLSNDSWFANAFGQESLADRVINFVGASMCEILPLQPYGGSSRQLSETFCLMKRGGSSHKVLPVAIDFSKKFLIVLELLVFFLEFTECLRESLGDKLSPKIAETALCLETFHCSFVLGQIGHCPQRCCSVSSFLSLSQCSCCQF